jgi:hypothetical protein
VTLLEVQLQKAVCRRLALLLGTRLEIATNPLNLAEILAVLPPPVPITAVAAETSLAMETSKIIAARPWTRMSIPGLSRPVIPVAVEVVRISSIMRSSGMFDVSPPERKIAVTEPKITPRPIELQCSR